MMQILLYLLSLFAPPTKLCVSCQTCGLFFPLNKVKAVAPENGLMRYICRGCFPRYESNRNSNTAGNSDIRCNQERSN